jgi:hypothetical protein
MPAGMEKIRKDILKGNPGMKESLSYALAMNIWKKRKQAGTTRNKASVSKSAAYKAYEKTEPKDIESKESYAEKVREMRGK